MIAVTLRVRLDITGVVQGLGFRPAVARIAAEYGLGGGAYNDAGAVHCEFEGPAPDVDTAVSALQHRPPPMARIDTLAVTAVQNRGDARFEIIESQTVDTSRTLVPPDISTCADCLREMRDSADRRFGRPFITCTNCGPRYTVITDLRPVLGSMTIRLIVAFTPKRSRVRIADPGCRGRSRPWRMLCWPRK